MTTYLFRGAESYLVPLHGRGSAVATAIGYFKVQATPEPDVAANQLVL